MNGLVKTKLAGMTNWFGDEGCEGSTVQDIGICWDHDCADVWVFLIVSVTTFPAAVLNDMILLEVVVVKNDWIPLRKLFFNVVSHLLRMIPEEIFCSVLAISENNFSSVTFELLTRSLLQFNLFAV